MRQQINRVWAAELRKFVLFRHVRQQRLDPGRLINRVWAAERCKFVLFRHVRQQRHGPGRLINRVWAAELCKFVLFRLPGSWAAELCKFVLFGPIGAARPGLTRPGALRRFSGQLSDQTAAPHNPLGH